MFHKLSVEGKKKYKKDQCLAIDIHYGLKSVYTTYVPERRSQAEESSVHQYTFIMISRKDRMFPGTRNRNQYMLQNYRFL
jgi:hypothetical protein